MDDVIDRVREYAKNLTNNGAPHQTGVGHDILKVVDLVDVTNAKAAVTDAAAISAASGAKALQDELDDVRGQLADALAEKSRLADAVADAAAENATLRAEIEHIGTLPVNKLDGAAAQSALPDEAPDSNDPNTYNAPNSTQVETGASKVQRRKAKS